LLGFEGHGGNRTPTILRDCRSPAQCCSLNEAFVEFERHAMEREQTEHETKVLKRWKKLIHGILLKDRLERDYGVGDKGED
jgi:xeroderma pigmentosum group C-complementing protein